MKKKRIHKGFNDPFLTKLLQIMKASLILFLVAVQVSASSYSQTNNLSLNLEKVTLSDFFNEVEEISEFRFFYDNKEIDPLKEVTINVDRGSLENVLSKIFMDSDISYEIFDRYIILKKKKILGDVGRSFTKQQQITISGNVTDENNLPLIGVNIVVKGTTTGTVTNLDGNYSLEIPSEDVVIVFSSIGYLPEEIIPGDRTEINISLIPDIKELDEVVVIGYGVQKKSNLTGSISSVDVSDIDNRTVADMNQAIQGKASGVQLVTTSAAPGAESSIRIRGYSSNTTSDPLYVVDGLRVNSISNIDPNIIESIEILKDAASAAIYGAEAGNGVILVTTKKGKSGEGKISYKFQHVIQSYLKKAEVMNAQQYMGYMVASNAIDQTKFDDWDGTETDWYDVLFESSPMQQHSISFQNATEKGSMYASLNYTKNDGIVSGNEDTYNRISGNMNVDYNIKKWLNFTSSNIITYNVRHQVAENSPYISAIRPVLSLDPLTPNIYKADNLPSWMQSLVDNGYKLVQDENGDYFSISNYLAGADDINPNILLYSGSTKSWDHFIQGNTALNLKPINGLVVTSRFGYRLGSNNSSAYQSAYYATATKNQDSPTVESTVQSSQYYQWENFANYTLNLGQHNFVFMAGSSFSSNTLNYVTAGGMGLQYDDELFAYPSYLNTDATGLINEGDEIINRKLSSYGRLTYDYANKYMLQASMRADAADLSILPDAKRWGYFPAVSLGWTISNEEWFPKDNNAISSLKLRASWGQNGSTAGLSSFAYSKVIANVGAYSFDANNSEYVAGSVPTSTGNPNLKWETSEQTNIGIDLFMFNNRLNFNTDYYVKKTKDLIVSGTTPTLTVGNTVSPINAGNVENKGFEFNLGWRDKIGEFSYSVSANMATLKNVVTYLDPSIDRISGFEYNRTTVTAFEKGFPVWYYIGYEVEHIDPATGNPMYVSADGSLTESPSSADLTKIGSGIPDVTYGLTVNLSYKNFDLTIFGQGTQGNDVFSGLTKTDRPQTNRLAVYYTDAWTSENPNAEYARMDYQESYYWQSSAVVFDGSYFKVKQIQLGYNVPENWLTKLKISSLRLYTSLDNFFLFTKYPGLDPETSSSSTIGLGVDIGSYPSPKNAVFGINVSF